MKEITRQRWARFGWFCMSFVPLLAYTALTLGVSTILMTLITMVAVMGGRADGMGLTEYLMGFSMPISIIFAVLGLVIFGLWYYFGCKRKQLRIPESVLNPTKVAAVILVAFGSQFLAEYLIYLIQLAAPRVVESYVELMEMAGIEEITWATILYVVILGPMAEELVFRGVTLFYAQKSTRRFWLANIIQALAFGIMHMNVVQGIYAFFLGLILGWVYHRFHSLYASTLLHIVFNFMGTCVLGNITMALEDKLPLYIIFHIMGIAAFAAGMVLLRDRRKSALEELL